MVTLLSDYATIALEQWRPDLVHFVLRSHPLLDKIKNDNVLNPKYGSFYDDKYIIGGQTGFGMGARFTAENAYLPSNTVSTFVKMTAALKTIKDRRSVSWELLNTSQSDKSFIENTVVGIQNAVKKSMSHLLNAAVYGYSTNGAIGTVGTGSSGTSLVLQINTSTTANTCGNIYFARGMPVIIAPVADFVGASWNVTYAPNTIGSVARSGATAFSTATLGTAYGACYAAGDLVIPGEYASSTRMDQYNGAITGLWTHINTVGPSGGATYQGITRANYPELHGSVISNSGTAGTVGALAEAKVQTALYTAALKTTDANVRAKMILTTYGIQQAWLTLFAGYRRYNINVPAETPESGYLDARMGALTPMNDPFCCPGQCWFLDTDSFTFIHSTEGGGGPDRFMEYERWGGNTLFFPAGTGGDKDNLELRVRARCQLVCETPLNNTVLRDITDLPVG